MNDIKPILSKESVECKNCEYNFKGQFCPKCGQKVITERNTVKHFFKLLFDSFDIDKGVLFTARILFTNPEIIVHDYLNGKTKKYYNPLKYLLVLTGIYAIFIIGLNIFDSNIETTNELLNGDANSTEFQRTINSYIRKYLSFFPILMIPFYGIVSNWVFRKPKLYFGEHLIINTYLFAQYILITTLVVIMISPFTSIYKLLFPLGLISLLIYYTYSSRKIFKQSIVKAFFKSLLVIILGMMFFMITIIVLSMIVFTIMALMGYNIQEIVK